ncbi:MAG: hypothetical protein V8T10_10250, partial [Merdibacter sp.]
MFDLNNRDITAITTKDTGMGSRYSSRCFTPQKASRTRLEASSSPLAQMSTSTLCSMLFVRKKNTYGNLQNYMVDTDPTTTMDL